MSFATLHNDIIYKIKSSWIKVNITDNKRYVIFDVENLSKHFDSVQFHYLIAHFSMSDGLGTNVQFRACHARNLGHVISYTMIPTVIVFQMRHVVLTSCDFFFFGGGSPK